MSERSTDQTTKPKGTTDQSQPPTPSLKVPIQRRQRTNSGSIIITQDKSADSQNLLSPTGYRSRSNSDAHNADVNSRPPSPGEREKVTVMVERTPSPDGRTTKEWVYTEVPSPRSSRPSSRSGPHDEGVVVEYGFTQQTRRLSSASARNQGKDETSN